MPKLAVSFSFDGLHRKSNGWLPAIDHLKMLKAAVLAAKQDSAAEIILSAIAFDPGTWPSEDERAIAMEVLALCRIVVCRNLPESHQAGAMWSIRYATEAAASIGAEQLIHTAEDVLMPQGTIGELSQLLLDHDYVGGRWGETDVELNTQCFAVRVKPFADWSRRRFLLNPFAMNGRCCERYIYDEIVGAGLTFNKQPHWMPDHTYLHTHTPAAFFDACAIRGIVV